MPPKNCRIDLQLFAQEKTEQATQKKLRDARRRGQVFKSQEMSSAVLLIAAFSTIYLFFPHLLTLFEQCFFWAYNLDPSIINTNTQISNIYLPGLYLFARIVAPLFGVIVVAGIIVNLAQIGFLFTGEALKFKPERLNPVEGFKRLFSKKALVQLIKSMLKLFAVIIISYYLINSYIEPIVTMAMMDIHDGLKLLGKLTVRLGLLSGLVLLLLAVADLLYQRWEHHKGLMMSKQEVKDERKQQEGDPQLKARAKEKQKQMSMARMLDAVPDATVVITNPTHYAIAIKYIQEEMSAPVVVAKGKNIMAKRIKDIAYEQGIYTFENPTLAGGLYWSAEVGKEIPYEFYRSVAEVLAFIYNLQSRWYQA